MSIATALAALRQGKIVGVPTDTVYGLAVDPGSAAAVQSLFELKGRPYDKPVALLVDSAEQAQQVVEMPPPALVLADRHWPGPLTLVVRSRIDLPAWVGDRRGTVGVRVPDHPVARALLAGAGPLAVTSANRSGEPPARDADGARAIFGDAVAAYLEGTCRGGEASTVVDMTVDPPRVVRPGPVQFGTQEGT